MVRVSTRDRLRFRVRNSGRVRVRRSVSETNKRRACIVFVTRPSFLSLHKPSCGPMAKLEGVTTNNKASLTTNNKASLTTNKKASLTTNNKALLITNNKALFTTDQ